MDSPRIFCSSQKKKNETIGIKMKIDEISTFWDLSMFEKPLLKNKKGRHSKDDYDLKIDFQSWNEEGLYLL